MISVYYDYAPRNGMRVEETERWLAPVFVDYDRGVSDAAA